jgi:hypothetical protein
MLRAEAVAAAETVLLCVQYYAAAGAVVAGAFLLLGIARVSPEAGGSYLFRLLLAPGIIGLWPLVLWRWIALERKRGARGAAR